MSTGLYLKLNEYLSGQRGVAIFAKAFLGIPAQQAAKITRPLMPSAAAAVLLHSLHTQRIRIDCVSKANHNLIRLLDKPDDNRCLISKYVFGGVAKWGALEDVLFS